LIAIRNGAVDAPSVNVQAIVTARLPMSMSTITGSNHRDSDLSIAWLLEFVSLAIL